MSLHRAGRSLVVLIVLVLLFGAFGWLRSLPVEGAAPRVLFVYAKGSGSACTQAAPCELPTALSLALDGDTLYVGEGFYYSSGPAVITITRSITLYGGWNGAPTGPVVRDTSFYLSVLDADGQGRVVYAQDCAFVLDGFVIQDGNATKAPMECQGGGILSYHAYPVITNNTIRDNVACTAPAPGAWGYGGGIAVDHATGPAKIRGNRIEGNIACQQASGIGGGIYVSYSSRAMVDQNEIRNNGASVGNLGYGGGVAIVRSDEAELSANIIAGNYGNAASTENGRGGGVYWELSRVGEIERNRIEFNTASQSGSGHGGGVAASWANLLWIMDNRLEGNSAGAALGLGQEGGAIKVAISQDILLARNVILGNAALGQYGMGGGIWMEANTSFRMNNNILVKNEAGKSGGGLALWADSARHVTGTLLHNTFAGNDSGAGDGRVALWVDTPHVRLQLVNNLMAFHSSALRVPPGSTANLSGTLFFGDSAADVVGGGTVTQFHSITGHDPDLNATVHLRTGSPAIDAGVTSVLASDIDGDARPWGAGWDIGADEYTPPRWTFVPLLIRSR